MGPVQGLQQLAGFGIGGTIGSLWGAYLWDESAMTKAWKFVLDVGPIDLTSQEWSIVFFGIIGAIIGVVIDLWRGDIAL
jgi:hypothetical protein